jgi:hypothetical protein
MVKNDPFFGHFWGSKNGQKRGQNAHSKTRLKDPEEMLYKKIAKMTKKGSKMVSKWGVQK